MPCGVDELSSALPERRAVTEASRTYNERQFRRQSDGK